jgi:tetratricopeptide (TPR) repeat protein
MDEPKPLPRWADVAVMMATLVVAFVVALQLVHESDTLWHLKTGEWIVSNGQVPRTDPFGDESQPRPWMNWEWLFQVIIYFIHGSTGFAGLVVVKAIVVAIVAGLILWVGRLNQAPWPLVAVLTMLAFAVARDRFEVRPDVMMFLLTVLTLWALEKARLNEPRWLVLLPVSSVLWANTHPSFPFGLCLIGAYAAGALLSRQGKRGGMVAGILAGCALVSLLNPYGFALFQHAVAETGTTGPAAVIGEWRPTRELMLTEPNESLRLFWWFFCATPIALVMRLWMERRNFPWAHMFVLAGVTALALRANRFIGLYAMVAVPMLAGAVASVFRQRPIRPAGWLRWLGWGATMIVAGLIVWVTVSGRWAQRENRPANFGAGLDERVVPVRALEVMKTLPAEHGLFNTFLSGGPVIWGLYPWWKPFSDGRANMYGRDFVERYRRAMRDPAYWESWMQQKAVSVVFIQYGSADDLTLLRYLGNAAGWRLFYYDHSACIFVRKELRARLPGREPSAPELSQPDSVRAYANRLAGEVAAGDAYTQSRLVATMGNFALALGHKETAHVLFEDALALHRRPSEAWMNLAQIAVGEQKFARAMELTGQLVKMNRWHYPARLLRAQIRAAEGAVEEAMAEVQRVLRQHPKSAQALFVKAQLEVRMNDRREAIRALQQAAAAKAEDPYLYWFLGRLLSMEGRTNEAVNALETSLQYWSGPGLDRDSIHRELEKLRGAGPN